MSYVLLCRVFRGCCLASQANVLILIGLVANWPGPPSGEPNMSIDSKGVVHKLFLKRRA